MPILRGGWHPCTSERLKRGVGAFVRDCRRGRFCPRNIENGTEETIGRLGRLSSLPMAFSDSDNTRFCLIGLRQNAQGKGNTDGSILKQDKSPAPQAAPGRLQRPAVRAAFRAFTDRGGDFGNCLERLAGVRFWGHFRAEKTLLASDLPESQLFQGIGTVSILLSQALLAEKGDFDRCPHEMNRSRIAPL